MKMSKFKEIIKKARGVQLKPDEKSEIRSRLFAMARGTEVQSPKSKVQSFGWRFFRPVPMSASLMIAVLAGGGVTLASENSLPGSLLYPVKVAVNEELRARLAFSPEAKVEWALKRAERRLIESEQLTKKGQLTPDRQKKIQAAFEEQVSFAENRIASKTKAEKTATIMASRITEDVLETPNQKLDNARFKIKQGLKKEAIQLLREANRSSK